MFNALNGFGILPNQKTYSDEMLNVRGGPVTRFFYGTNSFTGIAYLDAE
ncbi:hypothetical protein PROSTU_00831 [Providencia stuartii ATCC 25827]|uniref:Uncharacterized protein n=1 Tax=Providencia stuartii ATCC 25827 TaxID=471874 RepID=A0AA86YYY0_PROST|nr:hypothetical protein PROSTU_00831 [Providencia stuartii ATCC 25827]